MQWMVITAALATFLVVAALPGIIAHVRRHSKKTAITWCGLLSLIWIVVLLSELLRRQFAEDVASIAPVVQWMIAMVWSLTEDNRVKKEPRGFPVMPIDTGPGRLRAEGERKGQPAAADIDVDRGRNDVAGGDSGVYR